jgi:hypothetical protein
MTSSSGRQVTTSGAMATSTVISASGRPWVHAAMHTSRSVSMPTTRRPSPTTTGSAPQSPVQRTRAAAARSSCGVQLCTVFVMTCCTFIVLLEGRLARARAVI